MLISISREREKKCGKEREPRTEYDNNSGVIFEEIEKDCDHFSLLCYLYLLNIQGKWKKKNKLKTGKEEEEEKRNQVTNSNNIY